MAFIRRLSRLTDTPAHSQLPWLLPLIGVAALSGWGAIASNSLTPFDSGCLSSEHFILSGEIPSLTGLRALAHFGPATSQAECPVTNPLLPFDVLPGEGTRFFSFKVPLSYEIAGCRLDLTRVDFETEALYGTENLQRSISSSGALSVHKTLHSVVPGFPDSGERELRGLCIWQAGTAEQVIEPEWRFTCHAADQDWRLLGDREQLVRPGGAVSLEDLEGKRIYLNFRLLEAL